MRLRFGRRSYVSTSPLSLSLGPFFAFAGWMWLEAREGKRFGANRDSGTIYLGLRLGRLALMLQLTHRPTLQRELERYS